MKRIAKQQEECNLRVLVLPNDCRELFALIMRAAVAVAFYSSALSLEAFHDVRIGPDH
jgi:hypothetical protein